MKKSEFCDQFGILFAADIDSEKELFLCLDIISCEIAAVKLGNYTLYKHGIKIIEQIKSRYNLPVFADIKLTDVSHVAKKVAVDIADAGANVIVATGVCGHEVIGDLVDTLDTNCEIWVFTEFTNDTGLIDEELADRTIHNCIKAGALGVQAPGTRPYRIDDARSYVGDNIAIMSCGIGYQGGRFGSAIQNGANFEIIGRSIYASRTPLDIVREANISINSAREKITLPNRINRNNLEFI